MSNQDTYSFHPKTPIMTYLLLFFTGLFSLFSCNGDNPSFTADFSFTYIDSNHIQFTNESEGEYYSLVWDFGNGVTDTSTTKNKTYTIYYPVATTYPVNLQVMNYTGDKQSVSKNVTIEADDFIISFTANLNSLNSNEVLLENTSTGAFDSIQWHFREKIIHNQAQYTAYFPSAGSYVIQLFVFKSGQSFESSKTINITQDDPDYVSHLELVWEDEFNQAQLNTNDWSYDVGMSGWGNQELQNYTSGDNLALVDGKLIITAVKLDENTQVGSYTSSRIKTYGKCEFLYGRIEFRAKLPSGRGVWPALWLLGSNFYSAGWPACGEIDVMEYVGYQPNTVFHTIHCPSGYGGSGSGGNLSLPTCEEEFHTYGIVWTDKKIDFYIDSPSNIVYTYKPATLNAETWPFDKPAFIIMNLAVGGTWGGSQGIDNAIFPQTLQVDYIKVYQEQ
ncbi:MAG: family 16 glycosylhydrolase [Bacteroidales bacterium]|nr:family 16 glycosylhydrolase [Bacteroidales bacterium]